MEQITRTAGEALDAFDAVMASVLNDDRRLLSAPERLVLMQRARRFRDRFSSWTCVLTDEASMAALSATGTPLTSLIGLDEGRESGDAAKEVFEARGVNKNSTIRDAAIDGELSPRHAAAITKGLDNLPPELNAEQRGKAELAFIKRAPTNTPKQLTELAAEVLAEVAPELVPDTRDDDAVLEAQRRRVRRRWLHLPRLQCLGYPLRGTPPDTVVGRRGHSPAQSCFALRAPPQPRRTRQIPKTRRPVGHPHRPPHRPTSDHSPRQNRTLHKPRTSTDC